MSIDVIGNFLTVIRNGIRVSKKFVLVPYSSMKEEIAKILKHEGYINNYAVIDVDPLKKEIKIFLRYVDGESAIHEIKRVSKPGCRVYAKSTQIKSVIGGLGISIVSTNKGLVTDKFAKNEGKIGGEVVCTVW